MTASEHRMDGRRFQLAMACLLLAEAMFFLALFAALLYVRHFSLPWLGGEGSGALTGQLLYPGFEASWPSAGPESSGHGHSLLAPLGLPLASTLVLLISSLVLRPLQLRRPGKGLAEIRLRLVLGGLLGLLFLGLQGAEHAQARNVLGLSLDSGIYGSLYYLLTGMHSLQTLLSLGLLLYMLWALGRVDRVLWERRLEAVLWHWYFAVALRLGLFFLLYLL